jgi:endonuclease III
VSSVSRTGGPDRLVRLVSELKEFYGRLPTPPSDAFALFVWEVLSFHSTPRKRDAAFAALKRHRALTPDAMWKVAQKKLEESLMLAGPYLEQRIRALKTGVEIFRRTPALPKTIRGPLPAALRALKGLPQMGEGGGYRMLLFVGGHRALPVDAKVSRVAIRLGYGEKASTFARTARSIRQAVSAGLPDSLDAYRRAYMYIDHHGGATCTEADPHCHICPLLKDCPEGKKRAG